MKIRLLNASHSVLGILGAVYGHASIDDCVSDPLFAKYVRSFMDEEVTPVLDAVDGIDLEVYKDSLIERFGNPNIKDGLDRICSESSSKLPKFLIPTIEENLHRGGEISYSVLVLATWCFYSDKRVDRFGAPLDIIDELKNELHQAATGSGKDKLSFLKYKPVFGELASNRRLADKYVEMLDAVYDDSNISRLFS